MSNNLYAIYINKVMQLAETIVVKSTATADALNQYITDYYGPAAVDKLHPETWKYYLNICGEYHPTDTVMTVVSMDTLEKIIFNRENLAIHRATARNYVYGGRAYKELVAQYPNQEMLILGILYPVDMTTALAADDGAILSYPPELVEANEYSFIAKLQDWINGYKARWVNQQYGISDELYPATALGVMYVMMPAAILNIRLEACKTNEAHSFHVHQYLASHGMLDIYLDQLTERQALWLYRNIAYIERNSGKQYIFDWLVEHIMSERSLPIAEYTMRHDLSQMPDPAIYPTLAFRKRQLNLDYVLNPTVTDSLRTLLDKEQSQARDNPLYEGDNLTEIQETMENSLSNVELTKVLESSMIDYSNSQPYTLHDILMSHWLYLSGNGLYQSYIGIDDPLSGERIPVSAKDAFTFMWYAFCKSVNIELTTVPPLYAKRVQRIPTPSVDEIYSMVDPSLVDRSVAEEALSWQPQITTLISNEAFYNKCVEIFNAANWQRNLIALQEHQLRRGMVQGMVERIYSDNIVTLEPAGTLYSNWFAERNIKIDSYSSDQLGNIYLQLVEQATGLSLNTTNSLRALQQAMIQLMTELSSYSVQFLREINASDIQDANWTAVRIGDMETKLGALYHLPAMDGGALDCGGMLMEKATVDVDVSNVNSISIPLYNVAASLEIDVKPQRAPNGSPDTWLINVPSATVKPHLSDPPQPNSQGIIPVLGIDQYLALTADQQATVVDVWSQ